MRSSWMLSDRLVNRHQLRAVWKRPFDLNFPNHLGHPFHHSVSGQNGRSETHDFGHRSTVSNHFQDFGSDERDSFGMIQFEPARPALSRQLASRKNQKFVDF